MTLAHGVNPRSSILELGCGIGTMTYLLAKHVTSGCIEAMDSSAKSIQFATEKIKHLHVKFFTGDAVSYVPKHKGLFDFVLLYDVLKHIPLSQHTSLFSNTAKYMNGGALLLVNIPNPLYLGYLNTHRPETLQPLDEPLHLHQFIHSIYDAGLIVVSVETHSVSFVEDYQFIVLRKPIPFDEVPLSALRAFPEKVIAWLQRKRRSLLHRYP